MTKLYVGQLAAEITNDELGELFSTRGFPVTSARVICDREGGRSRGFGFVEFGSLDEAQRAMEELNGTEIQGRKILVKEAVAQGPRDGAGGRSARGGRATSVTGAK
ncbi:MAG TPA: RNA-binding protein [Candidatus Dormibacteraeota bacterium]|jgi:RNA recognition motif-containing protein|nr:RNA-binding protein [Candidatus Dormibacteraeota bacterium]